MHSITFVILKHTRSAPDLAIFLRCYESVKLYYPDNNIVIIDDNSIYKDIPDQIKNCKIIHSEFPGAGEILPYYYFLKEHWSDKMILLHDSMYLRKKITDITDSTECIFLWHFAEHKWDMDNRTIDLMKKANLPSYLIDYYKSKDLWNGCFGVATLISYNKLKWLEDTYYFIEAFVKLLKNRQDRMCMERIMAVAWFYNKYVTKESTSLFGDIIQIKQKRVPDTAAIAKTFRGR